MCSASSLQKIGCQSSKGALLKKKPLTAFRSLADSFARAGYLTVAPDMFNGTPASADLNAKSFNASAFLEMHGTAATDPIVASAIAYLRDTLKVKRIGVTGYCFGGRYAFRATKGDKSADAAFAAHPSLWTPEDVLAVKGPVSIAEAGMDPHSHSY
jgi:dienelactone hydrolase